jgi:hypothetical protein
MQSEDGGSTVVCVHTEFKCDKSNIRQFVTVKHSSTFGDVADDFHLRQHEDLCVLHIYCADDSKQWIEVKPSMSVGEIIPSFSIKFVKLVCHLIEVQDETPEIVDITGPDVNVYLMSNRNVRVVPTKKDKRYKHSVFCFHYYKKYY